MKTRLSLHLQQNTRRGERLARVHSAAQAALAASIRDPAERREAARERKRAGELFPPATAAVATPAGADPTQRAVTLAAHELHTLRAALPPIRDGRTRRATAKLLDAISELAEYLHAHRAGADDADLLAAAELVTLRIERWRSRHEAAKAQAQRRAAVSIPPLLRSGATPVLALSHPPAPETADASSPARRRA
ncbi:MAG: hypothetical protein J0H14_04610 [Alphaproteobacteria bacterium]|nr:hypothetical protein [Alphaproteobacteria bacterium]